MANDFKIMYLDQWLMDLLISCPLCTKSLLIYSSNLFEVKVELLHPLLHIKRTQIHMQALDHVVRKRSTILKYKRWGIWNNVVYRENLAYTECVWPRSCYLRPWQGLIVEPNFLNVDMMHQHNVWHNWHNHILRYVDLMLSFILFEHPCLEGIWWQGL